MKSSSLLSGALLVFAGASSYGMLSTVVKLSYREGYTTAEVTTAQFAWGLLVLAILNFVSRDRTKATRKEIRDLVLTGTTIGTTSIFYYVAVHFIAASVAVVLLMQSIWMGVLFEAWMRRSWPSKEKCFAVVLVLIGTCLATNAFAQTTALDARGLIFGLLAALSYSGTMVATGSIAPRLGAIKRSLFMLIGGSVAVAIFAFLTQLGPYLMNINWLSADFVQAKAFNPAIFLTYGLFVAIFGTILPPILLNAGFPKTGVGLGSIISSIELPFAAFVAFALLGEHIAFVQMLGMALILVSVFVLNYRMLRRANETDL